MHSDGPEQVGHWLRKDEMERRLRVLVLATAVMLIYAAAPTSAASPPLAGVTETTGWNHESAPVRPDQEATAARKLQLLQQYTVAAQRREQGMSSDLTAATVYTVPTYEREQDKDYYCGPAAVQDVADFAWNMGKTANKYPQQKISNNWTKTDYYGQTLLVKEEAGANGALEGSPKSAWSYNLYYLTSGAMFIGTAEVDIIDGMPEFINLTPAWFDGNKWWRLPSWKSNFIGAHWVVGNGLNGDWDGTNGPQIQYDDGSAKQGGGTGTWWVGQLTMWKLIYNHHAAVVY